MNSKVTLCRTRLEEVESQLDSLITEVGEDSLLMAQITSALRHVRKAIEALKTKV
jgi:hypothetical protein